MRMTLCFCKQGSVLLTWQRKHNLPSRPYSPLTNIDPVNINPRQIQNNRGGPRKHLLPEYLTLVDTQMKTLEIRMAQETNDQRIENAQSNNKCFVRIHEASILANLAILCSEAAEHTWKSCVLSVLWRRKLSPADPASSVNNMTS